MLHTYTPPPLQIGTPSDIERRRTAVEPSELMELWHDLRVLRFRQTVLHYRDSVHHPVCLYIQELYM